MKSRTESSARRTGRMRTIVTIAVTIGMCPDAWADEASDIRAGQELASKVCSPCHVVAERPGPTFAENRQRRTRRAGHVVSIPALHA
jgi:cytochrome c2